MRFSLIFTGVLLSLFRSLLPTHVESSWVSVPCHSQMVKSYSSYSGSLALIMFMPPLYCFLSFRCWGWTCVLGLDFTQAIICILSRVNNLESIMKAVVDSSLGPFSICSWLDLQNRFSFW